MLPICLKGLRRLFHFVRQPEEYLNGTLIGLDLDKLDNWDQDTGRKQEVKLEFYFNVWFPQLRESTVLEFFNWNEAYKEYISCQKFAKISSKNALSCENSQRSCMFGKNLAINVFSVCRVCKPITYFPKKLGFVRYALH